MIVNSPFCWQLLILVTGCINTLMSGLLLSFTAVLNPLILNPNSTDIKATLGEAALIGAIVPYTSTIGFIILPLIMQAYGRRMANFVLFGTILLGWIIIIFAKNVSTLILGRFFQGLNVGAIIVNSIFISEYCDPKRRGFFIVIKKCFFSIGVVVNHVLMKYLSWREIAGLIILINFVALILVYFWPESPAFFALKGKYKECEKVFIKLRGNTLNSRKELAEMIAAQKGRLKTEDKMSLTARLRRVMKKFLMKDFQKVFVIAVSLIALVELSGRHFLGAYLVEMLTELMGDESMALNYSIGNHTLTIAACLLGGILLRFLNRRSMLFIFGALSILLMFFIAVLTLSKSYFVDSIYEWLVVSVLISFSFIGNLAIGPVAFTLIGEIFSLEHRGIGTSVTGVALGTILGLNIQTTPALLKFIGLAYTFLIYGIISVALLIVLYFILPETKDKTLQEIEFLIKGIKNFSVEVEPILLPQDNVK